MWIVHQRLPRLVDREEVQKLGQRVIQEYQLADSNKNKSKPILNSNILCDPFLSVFSLLQSSAVSRSQSPHAHGSKEYASLKLQDVPSIDQDDYSC